MKISRPFPDNISDGLPPFPLWQILRQPCAELEKIGFEQGAHFAVVHGGGGVVKGK